MRMPHVKIENRFDITLQIYSLSSSTVSRIEIKREIDITADIFHSQIGKQWVFLAQLHVIAFASDSRLHPWVETK